MFAFALAVSFKEGVGSKYSRVSFNKLNFFLLVTIVAWLGVMALFTAYLMNIINILAKKTPLVFGAVSLDFL